MKDDQMNDEIVRTDINTGLSDEQVRQRVSEGKTNFVKKSVGKTYASIIIDNVLTVFNLIGLIIFVLVLITGSYSNAFFYVVIFLNTLIGIIQEIRAKRTIEKLSLLSAPTVTVKRDGKTSEIALSDIALDDVIELCAGKQIPSDCQVVQGRVEVNESMLTGESNSIVKKLGARLYSGSYVVSGQCLAQVVNVGENNYIEKLTSQAKKYTKPNSELMNSISKIINLLAIIVFPLGIATFLTSYLGHDLAWQKALLGASGAMVSMIPSGMVLLTSVTLAVSVVKMGRANALVQDLYSIEMLAHVDTLCLDKTGTITDGTMTVESVTDLDIIKSFPTDSIIKTIQAATKDVNDTAKALKNYFAKGEIFTFSDALPFSSERKYSGCQIDGLGYAAVGAPEFVCKNLSASIKEKIEVSTAKGYRALLLCKVDNLEKITSSQPLAIIVISDTLRDDAGEIIKWFSDNSVDVKVISGDNAQTTSVIARRVGVKNADKYITLDNLTDEQVIEAANKYTVFGRVKPHQKALIIQSLKDNGRTVAMTGDGVNDILAMRKADCSVAIASGSSATRQVAHIVLMDNKFSSMPRLVKEGRQVVNNIQNSTALFLMKSIMALLVTVITLVFGRNYLLSPRNMYAMELFIIGVPSFFLALRPNSDLIKGKFLNNTMWSSVPKGLALTLSVLMVFAFEKQLNLNTLNEISTLSMVALTFSGLVALTVLCYPINKYSAFVCFGATVGSALTLILLDSVINPSTHTPDFMEKLSPQMIFYIIGSAVATLLICVLGRVLQEKYKLKLLER